MRVQPDHTSESSDEEYICMLGLKDGDGKVPKITVIVNGIPISMMVDTGASTIIMDEATFAKLQSIELQSTSSRIFAYGSKSQLSVLGKFQANIEACGNAVNTTVHVVQGAYGSLMNYETAVSLGVVDIRVTTIETGDQVAQKFPSVFQGIGNSKLKNLEVKLHIDQSVPPVAQLAQRIPFHLRKKLKQSLTCWKSKELLKKLTVLLHGYLHW